MGTNRLEYPQLRNFAQLPMSRYRVKRVRDLNKIPVWFSYQLRNRIPLRLENTFSPVGGNAVSLHHLFNGLSKGSKPWVTTFETTLPRWGDIPAREQLKGIQMMAGASCKKLIAMSQCNADLQRKVMQEQFPDFETQVMQKVTVIHPAQDMLVNDLAEKKLPMGHITLAMVGTDFYRKGGAELLRVMDRLLTAGLPYQLVIVSKMTYGDWASKTTPADHEAAMKIIRRHPQRILLHQSLPYAEVLDVFRRSHIGLLPTWADSYGYSVLEAQAAGCAVISTNLRALPEINTEERGWLLNMPLNEWKNGRIHAEADRVIFRETLEAELERVLRHIAAHPQEIAVKAAHSLAWVRDHHSPVSRAAMTERIYDAALDRG